MGRPRMLGIGAGDGIGIDPIAEEPHHHARSPGDGGLGPDPAALACAISAKASAVMAVMRRGLRHPRADDAAAEHPLVASLRALRRLAFSSSQSPALPAAALRPFLDAVRSEDAGAAVTSASLAALHEVMSLTGPALPGAALREVVDAVASCRFEAGAESAAEEAVLMRMLQALLARLRAPAAPALGDQHVCTAVNTCFRVVHQASAKSELLQRFSRHAMHELGAAAVKLEACCMYLGSHRPKNVTEMKIICDYNRGYKNRIQLQYNGTLNRAFLVRMITAAI